MNSRTVAAFFGIVLVALTAAAQPLVRSTNRFETLPPEPPRNGYSFVDTLPGITFDQPVGIMSPPGETNRLFVIEKTGRIMVVTNLASPTKTVFMNLTTNLQTSSEQGLLGLAFHPRYAENGRFFVYRTPRLTPPGGTAADYEALSEFRVSASNPNAGDPGSEIPLIRQRDEAGNHNGGDVHFGRDGYLYLSLGDEGGGNDQYGNGQVIDRDFFAGVLRLDVDFRAGSLPPNRNTNSAADLFRVSTNYAVPADNPFVGATTFLGRTINTANLRTEFWAVGLRNPWRMSFDQFTGELWIGDVGQDRWEMVHVSRKGANHGWSYREGNVAGPRTGAPADFLTNPAYNYVPPIHVYPHGSGVSAGNSITGGRVYRGNRISALHGAYIFADYVSGNVWSLRRRDGTTPLVERLGGLANVVAFGADPRNGDILAAQIGTGRIMRLTATAGASGTPFPPTLADTGAFSDINTLDVSPAFTAYDVNLPFWSDFAVKRRWFHVPPGQNINFSAKSAWSTPAGSVWMKHFELELTNGVPESRRRIETRFIMKMTNGVYGITYRWTSPTNAVLVPDEGADERIMVQDAGGPVERVWHYPSRTECLSCHNTTAGWSLSFNTRQLNHDQMFPGEVRTNLIGAMSAAGYFSNPPENFRALATFSDPPSVDGTNATASLEWRVRRYLDVNCAFCHQPGGGGGGSWDGRIATPTDSAGIINGNITVNFGIADARVIAPGSTERSILLNRISRRDSRKMPPIASNVADPNGIALITEWIQALTNRVTYAQWLGGHLGTNFVSEPSRTQDTDGDGAADYLEFLTGTNPTTAGDTWRPEVVRTETGLSLRLAHPANVALKVEGATDLSLLNWQPLDAPGNEPRFLANESILEVPLPTTGAFQLYRVSLLVP